MDSDKDYYAVLEVTQRENLDGIHKAFRRLAKQCHPDRAGAHATGRFRAILEAYQVLSDPQQRRLYDEAVNGSRARMAPEPLVAQRHQRGPEPFASTPIPFPRPGKPVWGMVRQEVGEFGRMAEVLLSPILLSADITTDEADFIRLYLSQLIDRYGL
jgi:curved DNA-binding protein CbpA